MDIFVSQSCYSEVSDLYTCHTIIIIYIGLGKKLSKTGTLTVVISVRN